MTTIKIDLPDGQAELLARKAMAQGLTLESWFQKLAAASESAGNAAGAIDWSQCPVVESIPGKVSGAWVLKETRMPVSAIFENLDTGANIDDIMEWFAGLDRSQVEAVIEFAVRSLDRPPVRRGSVIGLCLPHKLVAVPCRINPFDNASTLAGPHQKGKF